MDRKLLRTTTLATCVVIGALAAPGVIARAQQITTPQVGNTPAAKEDQALKVDVVITRFEGDKKTSSLPFSLWVRTRNNAAVRMGSEVPMPATSDGKASVSYRSVGTSIDCRADLPVAGLFNINITIQDSSVYGQEKTGQASSIGLVSGYPLIRSFSSNNSLMLRDGQTADYVMATDKVTGEVLKASVTLTLVK